MVAPETTWTLRYSLAQVLDHGLVIAEHLVHDKPVAAIFGLDHHDLLAFRPRGLHPEIFAEPDVGNDFAAHVGQVIAVRVLRYPAR